MKTKKLFFIGVFLTFKAHACFIKVTNDTNESVVLCGADSQSDDECIVNPGEETVFGNKTTKANFILSTQEGNDWKKRLQIMQTDNNMTEEEQEEKDRFIYVSRILNRDLGEMNDLFRIENYQGSNEFAAPSKAAGGCGCKP